MMKPALLFPQTPLFDLLPNLSSPGNSSGSLHPPSLLSSSLHTLSSILPIHSAFRIIPVDEAPYPPKKDVGPSHYQQGPGRMGRHPQPRGPEYRLGQLLLLVTRLVSRQ